MRSISFVAPRKSPLNSARNTSRMCRSVISTQLRPGALFCFLLLLLTDADFGLLDLRVFESFVVVARDSLGEERVNVRVPGKYGHQSVIFVALRAEWSEAFDIGNCHSHTILAKVLAGFGKWLSPLEYAVRTSTGDKIAGVIGADVKLRAGRNPAGPLNA